MSLPLSEVGFLYIIFANVTAISVYEESFKRRHKVVWLTAGGEAH
jgi:hypothetical protein